MVVTCIQGESRCHPGVNQALVITVPAPAKAGRYNLFVDTAGGISNVVPLGLTRPRFAQAAEQGKGNCRRLAQISDWISQDSLRLLSASESFLC